MKKKTVTGWLAAITFILAAVALQLYFNKDHYFAMNRAKCSFTMIVLIGAMITVIARPVERIWTKQEKQRMTLLDWCVLVFGCSSLVTCLLSQDPALTLVGTKGMFVGAFSYFTGMLVYFVVSRNMIPQKWIVGVLVAGWTLIFVWTIINQCGQDVFGMHQNMKPDDLWRYVSSMGNSNSASVAFAAMIPFTVMLLIMTNEQMKKYLLALICLVALIAVYSLSSDGVIIGLLTMIPFVLVAAMSDLRRVNSALLILIVLGLSLAIYHFLCICSMFRSAEGLIYRLSGYWVGEILAVIGIVLQFLLSNGAIKFNERSLKITRTALVWTCVAILVAFITYSIAKSIHDPHYATGRGAIWKGNVWTFRLFTPIEMIFGQGSGMFAKNATLAYSMLLGIESNQIFATSHDIILQALLGNGIIGLMCLLTGIFSLLSDWFKEVGAIVRRPMPKYESIRNVEFAEIVRVASLVAVMGFVGSSLVESTYPHTTILLFALLALYRSCFFVPGKSRVKKNELQAEE